MPHAPLSTQHPALRTLLLLLSLALAFPSQAKPAIHWEPWSDDVFARATREHKFVLLDLEAVWCHWCHVMDEMTYADDRVIKLMNAKYIAVRVDQDSRPDLSNRYEDYGWPATIVFAADRSEIVKRSGYIPPVPMASMLQAIIDDPSPGPSVVKETPPTFGKDAVLAAPLAAQLEKTYKELIAKGVEFVKPPEKQPWGIMAIMKDSEGNQIVLGTGK